MSLEKLQKELEKFQAEMINIQKKYSNPTPENIAKMQSEIIAITKKMDETSKKLAAESLSYDEEDEEDEEEDYFDEEAREQFIKDHPAPKDKAKYLPIGALLLYTNGEPFETFALTNEKEDWLEAMENGWDLDNAEDGKKMLASLLKGRHEATFGEDYRNFKAGKEHELDDDSVESYEETLENLKEELPSLLPYIKKCDNILAWDYERAGYLARIFTHLGWIKEADAFKWMEKTAEKIKEKFSKWEEYAVSVLVGRALAIGFD